LQRQFNIIVFNYDYVWNGALNDVYCVSLNALKNDGIRVESVKKRMAKGMLVSAPPVNAILIDDSLSRVFDHDAVVATVPLGYADGVFRALGGRIDVLINGRLRRSVGRMCMDQFVVDLGPEVGVSEGDEAILFGAGLDGEPTAQDWAELLGTIHREDFVPEAHRALAFADTEIPLPAGQCMLAPRLEARMLQDLALQPTDTVLEVGAGSGYMAALLAHRARDVLSLEIEPALVAMARRNLQQAGIHNATVRQADGAERGTATGTFDVVVLSGSVPEVPQHLMEQLKVGGRLAAIVGDEPVMRMTVITRTSATDFQTRQPWDTVASRLQHFPEPSRFAF
jgi:protein-L-isoaspartate(D-aspartate) O-methyltransferase